MGMLILIYLINKNIEVRFDSTSGGAFSALADEIYKKSGYVGGAIYNCLLYTSDAADEL